MISRHLTLERIAGAELTETEQQHLAGCAFCQADALLHSEFQALVPADEPLPPSVGGAPSDLPFALLRWLGAGPHGAVYEALGADGVRVAVKVLIDGVVPDNSPIPHPNLAGHKAMDLEGYPHWIASPIIHGTGLSDGLQDRSVAAGAAALLQILNALDALHRDGRAHGHLCPANVRLEPGGRVVVLDAGLDTGSVTSDIDAFRGLILDVCEAVGEDSAALRRVLTVEREHMRNELEALTEAEKLGRYEERATLGEGGMGKVHRVFDAGLARTAAMKVLAGQYAEHEVALSRFLLEARVTAQLQHPGIVPVYEIGRLPDGRPYYTMMEVEGQTLGQVISASRRDGTNIRRVVRHFLQTCETVAYAHARGVIHRDLKPANVMVGEFGEVRVLDWGLARIGDEVDDSVEVPTGTSHQTRMGDVAGTAAYMPPEQARGDLAALGPHSDVYALGAILYQILTGVPPYTGATFEEIVAAVLAGPPDVPRAVPEALEAIRLKAMSVDASARFTSAAELGAAVRDWLEGAKRRERALEGVARSDAAARESRMLRARAVELRERGAAELAEVPTWAPVEDKQEAWAFQDHASRLEQRADQKSLEMVQHLRSSLIEDGALTEAHDRLAAHYMEMHRDAEGRRNTRDAAHFEQLLRFHDRGEFAEYLQGKGTLTLETSPSGAAVTLYRYRDHQRRLVASDPTELGTTPLRDVPLDRGSWLVEIRVGDRPAVLYPVSIGRGEHWDSGEIHVPEDPGDAVWIPEGWFWSGGDPSTGTLPKRRLWAADFAIQRFPVTNRNYLAFLNDLVARGREEDALAFAPRERGSFGSPGAVIYGYADGAFFLQPDADGDVWMPEWPVLYVTLPGAEAYAAWLSDRTGRTWRLPTELEWEKAARGVDGRKYPWGDFCDPTWARSKESTQERNLPCDVDTYPIDESPYGVRGMAGNVRERCADLYRRDEGPTLLDEFKVPTAGEPGDGMRPIRGGSWGDSSTSGRCASRGGLPPGVPGGLVGFRLAFTGTR